MPPSNPGVPRSRNPRYLPPEGDHRPIEKLPPEILVYIFELGTHGEKNAEDWEVEEDDGDDEYEDVDDSDEDDNMSLDIPGSFGPRKANDLANKAGAEKTRTLPFQVRMSHVSRRWRELAVQTPTLWTSIDFCERRPWHKTQEWLIRSKQTPLDITIDHSMPDDSFPDGPDPEFRFNDVAVKEAQADLGSMLNLIIPHAFRWRTFELTVDVYEHMVLALKRLEQCPTDPGAPLLQIFNLNCHEDHDDSEPENVDDNNDQKKLFLPFGGHAPKLGKVGLWGVHLDWRFFIPASERLPSSLAATPSVTTNLTELELAYHSKDVRPSYVDFVNIIRCSPKLISLKLMDSGPAPRLQGSPAQPLFLPSLRHLSLEFFEEDYAISLLRLLYTPSLKSVTLDFEDGDYTEFVKVLVEKMHLPEPLPAYFDISAAQRQAFENRTRLSGVTDVKLSGLPCAETCAFIFYSNCRNLKRLHVDSHFLPSTFVSVLDHDLCELRFTSDTHLTEEPCTDGPLCKQLDTLTVSGVSGRELVRLVKYRKASGAPIRELNVDEKDAGVSQEIEFEWLMKNVKSLSFVEISDDEDAIVTLDSDVEEEWEFDDEEMDDEDEDDDGDEGGNAHWQIGHGVGGGGGVGDGGEDYWADGVDEYEGEDEDDELDEDTLFD